MKKAIVRLLPLSGLALLCFSFTVPAGWFTAGSEPAKYEMGLAPGAGRDGKQAASIRSRADKIKGFGTLMQNIEPGIYAGKKVKLSAYAKTENVTGWAGFWMRVDQAASDRTLGFDNMQDRPIKGNTDWTRYEITLSVPRNASNIAYGCLLSGTGQVWFDDFSFEILGDAGKSDRYLQAPANLNFED